jgi:hypothetical protein
MPTFKEELYARLTDPHRLKPYKESSVKPVWSYLKKLNGGSDPTSIEFLLNRHAVMKIMDENFKVSTQRSIIYIINNVGHAFKRNDILEVWKDNIEDTKAGEGLLPPGEKSEKQKSAYEYLKVEKNGDAWDAITAKVAQQNADADEHHEKYRKLTSVVPNLYTMFPPRRNIDYTEMMIATDETDITDQSRNYLAIQEIKGKIGMMFIFNIYKTSGIYRQQAFELPDDLVKVLMNYIKARGKKDGDYLLTGERSGEKFDSWGIVNILHEVFGGNISTQMLRHMYLDKYNTPERKIVIEEMMGDADKMAHSIVTQQATYVKK